MILFHAKRDGTVTTTPELVPQGSSMQDLVVVSEFDYGYCAIKLLPASGEYIEDIPCTPILQKDYSTIFTAALPPKATMVAGSVDYQLIFTAADGTTQTTLAGSFTVPRGVPVSTPGSVEELSAKTVGDIYAIMANTYGLFVGHERDIYQSLADIAALKKTVSSAGYVTIPVTEWEDGSPTIATFTLDGFGAGMTAMLIPADSNTQTAAREARLSAYPVAFSIDSDTQIVEIIRADADKAPDIPLRFAYLILKTDASVAPTVAILGVDAYGEGGTNTGGVDQAAVEAIVKAIVPGWARQEEPPEESDPTVSDWAKAAKKPTYDKYDVGLSNVDNAKQYSTINPPPYPVTSVNGKEGAVSLAAEDVGADAAGSAQAVANQVAQDLQSYYSREEVDNLISAIPKFSIEVVASLPTSGISRTTVYLVKNKTDSGDLYTEYIYANGAWEELGRQRVDLSGYSTTTQMNTAISTALSAYITQNAADGRYAKKGDIPSKVSQLTNDAGYLNASAGDERYATPERLPTKVSQLTNDSGYLDTLAGDQRYAMAEDLPTLPSDIGAEPAGAAQAVAQSIANDLKSYYKKTDTYSRTEVDNLISAIPKFSIVTASSLPTSNISLTTVYLVKDKTSSGDLYTEYIYVNNAWEELGRQTVNLSGYVTLTKLNTALSDYALKANVPSKTSQLTNDSNFAVTTKAETWSFILSDGTVVTKKVVLA